MKVKKVDILINDSSTIAVDCKKQAKMGNQKADDLNVIHTDFVVNFLNISYQNSLPKT